MVSGSPTTVSMISELSVISAVVVSSVVVVAVVAGTVSMLSSVVAGVVSAVQLQIVTIRQDAATHEILRKTKLLIFLFINLLSINSDLNE